jgi:hypothetical protein
VGGGKWAAASEEWGSRRKNWGVEKTGFREAVWFLASRRVSSQEPSLTPRPTRVWLSTMVPSIKPTALCYGPATSILRPPK